MISKIVRKYICEYIENNKYCYRLSYVRSIENELKSRIDCITISPTMGDIAFCTPHGKLLYYWVVTNSALELGLI